VQVARADISIQDGGCHEFESFFFSSTLFLSHFCFATEEILQLHARTHAHTHARMHARTQCSILSDMVDYLANRWFYWKIFRTKVAWLKGDTWWKCELDLEWFCKNQVKIIIVFLNKNPHFLLYFCGLSQALQNTKIKLHNNKVLLSIFRVMELESYYTADVIYVRMRMWAGFLCACVSAIYRYCLIYAYAHGIESNPSHLNDSTFLFSSYSFSFIFFFTLVDFFNAFFKMTAYNLNEIDIILVLSEAGWNHCRAERLYRNRYPFKRHSNAIRRILYESVEESIRETASK